MASKYDIDNEYGDDFCLSGSGKGGGGGGRLGSRKKIKAKQKTNPDGRYNSKHIRIAESKKNYANLNEKKSDLVEPKKTKQKMNGKYVLHLNK